MTYRHTLAFILAASFVTAPAQLPAQSVTVLSGGGDASACSLTARMAEIAHPMRSDVDACNRALDQVQLTRADRAGTYVNRGIIQSALGRYQEALNDYNDALDIQADMPQAFVGKGNLYFLAERFNEAVDAYDTALELNLPERHAAYYNLGLTYERMGDPLAAERNFRAALELVPEWTLPQEKLKRMQEQRAQ